MALIEEAEQRVLALIAAVGVEVIRQLARRGVGRARVADGGVDGAEGVTLEFGAEE